MQKISKIEMLPDLGRKKQVAGYCRVSCGKDAMLHSLSTQVSYLSALIQGHNDWIFAGIYADEAKTGTKESRPEFQRMLSDCRTGKIDMIITKSISRFARNTVTLLETVRKLKSLGVDVFFEEQNLHSISGDGELMLTILASYAQEESKSVSDNMKWRIKKNFEEGMPWDGTLLGYRYKGGRYVIQEDEAKTVRRIFELYLSGKGCAEIVKTLNAEGVPTRLGKSWSLSVVQNILRNVTYTGNLLLQKTFTENHITKKTLVNHGELPQYYAEETHEAIISKATFDAVQEEISRRAPKVRTPRESTSFTGKLQCAICGKNYHRKSGNRGMRWMCTTFDRLGKQACPSRQIPEDILLAVTAEVLDLDEFSVSVFENRVSGILVCPGNRLIYKMADGTECEKVWKEHSRRESWTPEMREAARLRKKEAHHAKGNHDSVNH